MTITWRSGSVVWVSNWLQIVYYVSVYRKQVRKILNLLVDQLWKYNIAFES